jgi:hypothetical protein
MPGETVKTDNTDKSVNGDDGVTVKTGNTDKSAGLTDKSVGFLENRCDDFRAVFVGTQMIFIKNR